MPTKQQYRRRLITLLKGLFQLDKPDLDFGFYRIMHAKAEQVSRFLENDLLRIVEDAFGSIDNQEKSRLEAEYKTALENARQYGVKEPGQSPPVKKAREALQAVTHKASAEGEVYDHLYRFFERYYDSGDFLSRRYYTRETSDKAAPYAIPYQGEEVKLHWANADQYYIKTTEYFSNFSFDLKAAAENQLRRNAKNTASDEGELFDTAELPEETLRVQFRILDAAEGEHGNIKASEKDKRFFIIHRENPIELTNSQLTINFEYRPDPDKGSSQEGTWRDRRNSEASETVLKNLADIDAAKQYNRLLSIPAPTDKQKNRPLLAKYINQYTSRNTMDYFIHKDLGGFLKRELDFYIKNEVMRLDDIENADAAAVESYLGKIKVLRKIAGKLIDFIAQLEDFQKKLWLKKKFVYETNYCITLDRVPEELYPEIAANDAQRAEWINLFAIDEIEPAGADLIEGDSPGYCEPLTVEFLKANSYLVLDTAFFDEDFKARLISSIEDFDEQCDGLLIHSENFHALNLLQQRYKGQVNCSYIDPPYNTSASEIIYKNSYKHSSWLSFIGGRIPYAQGLMQGAGITCITIDDCEFHRLMSFIEDFYSRDNIIGVVAIKNNPSGRATAKGFSIAHEYAIFVGSTSLASVGRLRHTEEQIARYKHKDQYGRFEWVNFRKHGGANANRPARPKLFYPIFATENSLRIPEVEWDSASKNWTLLDLKQAYLICC